MTQITQEKTVLVLGASGQLGRMMCALGAGDGLSLIPVYRDLRSGGVLWSPGAPVPQTLRADAVLALWGVTVGAPSDLAQNCELALAAQAIGHEIGADRVLHCSSVAVYRPGPAPLTETCPTAPVNPYGEAKLAMEEALAQAQGVKSTVMRIGNVAGADSLFAAGRRDGTTRVTRYPNGFGPLRSYIAPGDLVRALRCLLTCNPEDLPSVVNLAAPKPVRMEDLAKAMGWHVDWTDVADDGRQDITMQTDRLRTLIDLGPDASDPTHIARDVISGGWHL